MKDDPELGNAGFDVSIRKPLSERMKERRIRRDRRERVSIRKPLSERMKDQNAPGWYQLQVSIRKPLSERMKGWDEPPTKEQTVSIRKPLSERMKADLSKQKPRPVAFVILADLDAKVPGE